MSACRALRCAVRHDPIVEARILGLHNAEGRGPINAVRRVDLEISDRHLVEQ
jgi:hypothetical protein